MSLNLIKITASMPSQEVLAVNAHKDFLVGYCSEKNGKYFCESDGESLDNVTHWMSLDELWELRPSDKAFAVVYKDFSFVVETEGKIERLKSSPNVLAVLPYDFYLDIREKDKSAAAIQEQHNVIMYLKVAGWIDGYKFANTVVG